MSMTIELTIYNQDGSEEVIDFPAKMEVCHDCEGHGYVLNASMREHAYTAEEFYEEFDEESREEYFRRGGIYDVICPTCKGKNVVPTIDRDACTSEYLKDALANLDKQEEERYYAEAENRAERRMEEAMERRFCGEW